MDSILGGDLSSPHMRIFGDGAISHLQHTQNSKQTSGSALQAVAAKISTVTSPAQRLSEYKMIVDGGHCPRFRKMKEHGKATGQ